MNDGFEHGAGGFLVFNAAAKMATLFN